MAQLNIKTKIIHSNIQKLITFLLEKNITFTLTTKVLCGHKAVLEKILTDDVVKKIHSFADSRLSSLKVIKSLRQDAKTMYIKPPAKNMIKNVIRYADISLNSSLKTIKELNKEAKLQNKIHEVIIMLEMGELREGVLRNDIVDFYKEVFDLSNIKVVGLGTNLGCMYGIEPTYDKLVQLSLYKQLLEEKFKRKIPYISGGSSITLPLLDKKSLPFEVNHFRIGEAAFFGVSPLQNKKFKNLSQHAFEFEANVIELEKKESVPDGKISQASIGHTSTHDFSGKTYRAIVDYGILDVDYKELTPKDSQVKFFGITSDMTVYDLGKNKGSSNYPKYHVHSKIKFKPTYMAVARLMNSKFVDKNVS
ncbi:MAG: alanine racemase [Candidatus Nanoarchaeia archaeon]